MEKSLSPEHTQSQLQPHFDSGFLSVKGGNEIGMTLLRAVVSLCGVCGARWKLSPVLLRDVHANPAFTILSCHHRGDAT